MSPLPMSAKTFFTKKHQKTGSLKKSHGAVAQRPPQAARRWRGGGGRWRGGGGGVGRWWGRGEVVGARWRWWWPAWRGGEAHMEVFIA